MAGISAWEGEVQRRAGVELRRVGDGVIEILVQEGVVRLDAHLPFIAAMVDGDHSLEITFVEPVVLKQNNRSGQSIGVEVIAVIAHHAAKIADHIGRENVPVGDRTHGFEIVGILLLARRACGHARGIAPGLLHDLVGKQIARQLIPGDEVDAVIGREVALVIGGKIADGSGVRVILRNHRIQIVIGLRLRKR